jgi:SAM-dependent methyltransferase
MRSNHTQNYDIKWEEAYKDSHVNMLWDHKPAKFLKQKARQLKDMDVTRVLDAGCGDGRNMIYYLKEGYNVVGVDVSPTALNKAFRNISVTNQKRFYLIRSDLKRVASIFPPGMFDAIVCWDTLGQVKEPRRVLTGFKKLLRNRGYFIANVPNTVDSTFGEGRPVGHNEFIYKGTLFKFYTKDDFRKLFAGFKLIEFLRLQWQDPPHGSFRPYPHQHDCWVVFARKHSNLMVD